jgi:hypothetical protein
MEYQTYSMLIHIRFIKGLIRKTGIFEEILF